jgi:hypothetical protein
VVDFSEFFHVDVPAANPTRRVRLLLILSDLSLKTPHPSRDFLRSGLN